MRSCKKLHALLDVVAVETAAFVAVALATALRELHLLGWCFAGCLAGPTAHVFAGAKTAVLDHPLTKAGVFETLLARDRRLVRGHQRAQLAAECHYVNPLHRIDYNWRQGIESHHWEDVIKQRWGSAAGQHWVIN